MTQRKRIKVYLYTRFERLWHWLQAGAITLLILTGAYWIFRGFSGLPGF